MNAVIVAKLKKKKTLWNKLQTWKIRYLLL